MVKGLSRKQAGVIYRNAKLGNIDATKEQLSSMYDYVEIYSNYVESFEHDMLNALRECIDAIFANDFAIAQEKFDRFSYIHSLHFAA